jgi:hypothetical protein
VRRCGASTGCAALCHAADKMMRRKGKEKTRKEKKRPIRLWAGIGLVPLVLFAVGLAGWQYHKQPQFCALCHLMDPYLASWTGERVSETDGSPLLVKVHADEGDVCLDCHEPTLAQQIDELKMYISDDYRDPPRERRFGEEECFKCHEHATREDLIERTKDYEVVFNVTGEFLKRLEAQGEYRLGDEGPINPHDYPTDVQNSVDPHAEGSPQLECNRCHKMHRESPGLDYCFGCHHSGTFAPCDTCHEARTRSVDE